MIKEIKAKDVGIGHCLKTSKGMLRVYEIWEHRACFVFKDKNGFEYRADKDEDMEVIYNRVKPRSNFKFSKNGDPKKLKKLQSKEM